MLWMQGLKTNILYAIRRRCYPLLLAGLAIVIFSASNYEIPSPDQGYLLSITEEPAKNLYLPLLFHPDGFALDPPIWTHNGQPENHEISLFRRVLTLEERVEWVELQIFADTRYELWIDGEWTGRGPARFSHRLKEYDIYPLGELTAGNHVLAVLVQWSPNNRRSMSAAPSLQGHLSGIKPDGSQFIERIDSTWRAMLSDAWRADAAHVHVWGLIGSSELLDLSRLPANWHQPGFWDDDWPNAVVRDDFPAGNAAKIEPDFLPVYDLTSTTEAIVLAATSDTERAVYQPRSIPFLENAPIPIAVIDRGTLSPGFQIGELVQPVQDPYSLTFNVANQVTLTVETLTPTISIPFTAFQLDGNALAWQEAGANRPDVYQASQRILAGSHELAITGIPENGVTFNVSSMGLEFNSLPFSQGVHAGRRLLLANPVSTPGAVTISPTSDAVSIQFLSLPGYAVLDLGRTIHGRIVMQAIGAPGSILDIGWDERLLEGTTRPLPYPGSLHPEWNQVDSWVLDGETRHITNLDTRAGRYILIAVWGETPVELQDIRVYEERLPLSQRGAFLSTNPLLDQIWQTGVDTLHPNMTDAYTDTPWRERGQWWGDAYVEDHINRVAFGDIALLRRGLLYMADAFSDSPSPGMAPNNYGLHMLDYTMLWAQSLYEYWQVTDDTDLLEDIYPDLLKFMDHLASYENFQTGLLDLPRSHWSQSAYIDMVGFHSRYGQSTAVNALYYRTLQNAAILAEEIGDIESAQTWRQKADNVKQSVNSLLYLHEEHRYLTNLYEGAAYPPTPHAQAWAISSGITPFTDTWQVSASLLDLLSPDPALPNVQVYGMYWVMDALGRSDRIPEAIDLIESYYGYMLDLGATTWWEAFDANLTYAGSLSHGWGGSPTWFLSTYVLGARRTGPNSWEVKPAIFALDHVEGVLPLREGDLSVGWDTTNCSSQIRISSPPGSSGNVIIPSDRTVHILRVGGELVPLPNIVSPYPGDANRQSISIPLGEGVHTLEITRRCSE